MGEVLVLHFYEHIADEEAVQRTKHDLGWKAALDLPLDFPGTRLTSLTEYRSRLIEHGKELYAYDRFADAGGETGMSRLLAARGSLDANDRANESSLAV